MNKKAILVTFAILILIGASVAYVLLRKNHTILETESRKTGNMAAQGQATKKGAYVAYSPDLLASTKGTRLLFFHAPWCPQCRALDESIRMSNVPDGVTIFKVDYDSNQPLRAKYGVTLQTTVVKVDGEGNKLASYVAYDEPTFQGVERALLP